MLIAAICQSTCSLVGKRLLTRFSPATVRA
jgi:hypothetical protein